MNKSLTAVPFFIIILCLILLIVGLYYVNQDKISDNQKRAELQIIKNVLTIPYDNDLLSDVITIKTQPLPGKSKLLNIYRARLNDQPVGLIIMPIITKGYSSDIGLVIGINHDGDITGVEVLYQHETIGFGDQIDHKKSNWLLTFIGHSIGNPPIEQWHQEDGHFDQLSGATITSRHVMHTIRDTLDFYRKNKALLFK